jgi:glycosyltransferase involved in cell wall biosynthesis
VRVLIDTTYAHRAPLSGTGIYIRCVCEELRRRSDVELVEVFNARRRPPAGGGLGSVRNLVGDEWWLNGVLPRLGRRAGAGVDVIHHPLPARSWPARRPQVVTVVDLAFERLPSHFDRGFRLYASRAHRAAARSAAAVICISETTAQDVVELWDVPRSRIVVAPLGPGQELSNAGERPISPKHFLYVGDDEPRKNVGLLLGAYRSYRTAAAAAGPPPLELVLAGSAVADEVGVRVVARPEAAELATLYRDAAALVHPSLYEGFGLTLVEAMSCGTPVLAARSPGVVEVAGEAARLVESGSGGAARLAHAMAELAGDAELRRRLGESGIRRAAEFSWARCTEAHVMAYRLAASTKRVASESRE